MPSRTPRSRLLLLAAAIAAASIAFAQNQTAPALAPSQALAYETASIRPDNSTDGYGNMRFTPDGFTALQNAIREAFGLYDDHRWSGGPPWLNERRFDIQAKVDPSEFKNLTLEQGMAMLQKLLADRFKLVVHHETRAFPLYALVVAKNGPKLQEPRPEDLEHSPDGTVVCVHGGRPHDLTFRGCDMQDLASNLTYFSDLGRTVVDKTGLTGPYIFKLKWTPDNPSASASPDPSAPSIFIALKEQLGLKLESTNGPLDTIVIDHVEMPSEN
jgi:uncharacterized protein (TIGR03435 family)